MHDAQKGERMYMEKCIPLPSGGCDGEPAGPKEAAGRRVRRRAGKHNTELVTVNHDVLHGQWT